MADGAVNFLLDKLTTILLQKASLLGDAYDEIEEIKFELESMRSFLRDAERRKERSESVEAWVRQVREVAYEVEDLIDEFMHHKNRRQPRNGFNGVIQDVVNFPENVIARHRIASKLQKIKAKVREISERSKRYDFDRTDDWSKNSTCDRSECYGESSSSAFVDEDEIVGMEENTEELLGLLMEDEPRRTIISIVGMGGLGKTTLVTRIYNDQLIKRRFDCWAWISVSQKYRFSELLRSIIKEFFKANESTLPRNVGSMNDRQLVEMLIDYLHQKSYVIVLDDVWSIDLWSRIRSAFPNNRYGSRIILTTRNENVAASVGIGSRIHRLEPLLDRDAWTLFCKKAFWSDPNHACPSELQPLAQAILKKCEGLPLAIVAVGGLMCSRSRTVVEWKKVYQSLNWQLSNNPMLERVKSLLLLSFNDLPFYLKHCFLYCCIFRDDYPIKRKKLTRLWAAEGFLVERKGMTTEEVAEEYLRELILRSMIQVTKTNDAGRVKTCRVHDVMRELAMTTSERENFCTAYDDHETRLEGKIQRLSVQARGESVRLNKTISCHLRSFIVFKTDMCSSFSLNALPKFKLLRVLDLQGVPLETLPGTLVCLFNLRYLNLRETKITELPKSIARLQNLQTLDVRNTILERLPRGVIKLQKLRHLYLHRRIGQNSPKPNISCGLQIPDGMWSIQSLQTLACVEADEDLLRQVGNLTELKRLEITKLRAADGPKFCSSIQQMTGLVHLGITAAYDEELQLEDLVLPPLFLQKLKLVGRLSKLPDWLGSLCNLTHLHLGLSGLREETLGSLHLLSSLVFLELRKAYNGNSLQFKTGWFPRLNKLKFQDLKQLDSLSLEEGSLPSIRELHLIRCLELKVLPQGIEYLNGLQKLHKLDCNILADQYIKNQDRCARPCPGHDP